MLDRVDDVLEFLEITHVADELAGNLSGGQKKLLDLGRTMMTDAKKSAPKVPADSLPRDPLGGLAQVLKDRPKAGAGLQATSFPSLPESGGGGGGGTVALRVLRRGAKPNKLEADQVHVPVDEALARTVIRADEKANAERQQLKRQILTMAS